MKNIGVIMPFYNEEGFKDWLMMMVLLFAFFVIAKGLVIIRDYIVSTF